MAARRSAIKFLEILLGADLLKLMEVSWLLSRNGKFLYRFVPTFELSQSIHDLELLFTFILMSVDLLLIENVLAL